MMIPTGIFTPRFAALLLCATITSAAHQLPAQVTYEAKSEASIKVRQKKSDDGESSETIVEQRRVNFHFQQLFQDNANRTVIIKEAYRTEQNTGAEGTKSEATIEFTFAGKDDKFPDKPSQRIVIPDVEECKFENDYWKATTFGCCASPNYSRLYTYGAERPFLRYHEEFALIDVPNANHLNRYIGAVARNSMPNPDAEDAVFSGHPQAVAAITIAAVGKPLHTLYLRPKGKLSKDEVDVTLGAPKLSGESSKDDIQEEGRQLTMWSLDGAKEATKNAKSVTGAKLKISLGSDGDGNEQFLDVTIENDKLVRPKISGKKTTLEVEEK